MVGQRGIHIVDVRLMMLVVMKLHRLRIDKRFESGIVIG
jgi:hypothetical protein